MRYAAPIRRGLGPLRWYVALALTLPGVTWPQSSAPAGEFLYHARSRDTLIGISRRLLIEPRRWREVQARNHITDPLHIAPGAELRIPYAWLRMSSETATVSALSGDVREGGNPLVPGQSLAEGSQVKTGSDGSVTLVLADGSVITLQKSTVLSLQEMRRITAIPSAHDTRLKLQSGRLQSSVKPHGNVGRFEIETPVAVSAVRGTQFRSTFEPQAANANTETLDGLVGVSASTSTVAVPANFGTHVERDAAPLPPRQLLPPPDLQGIPQTNGSSQLHLRWPTVPGAVKYRVQLAPDSEFRSFLIDAESIGTQLDLPAPADGSYWIRIRSIDSLGLEGPDAMRELIQHRRPASPTLISPAPRATVVGETAAFTWTGLEPRTHYRMQIARDENFTDRVQERDAADASSIEIEQLSAGLYFWRVAGVNDRGETGDWSPARQYTQRQAPPRPYPPNFVDREMQLHWDPQPGVRYRVQVARDPAFRSPLLDETLDTPSWSAHRPRPGRYYVRVQTIAEDGNAVPFGKPLEFEVPVPRWLKILLPLLTLIAFAP